MSFRDEYDPNRWASINAGDIGQWIGVEDIDEDDELWDEDADETIMHGPSLRKEIHDLTIYGSSPDLPFGGGGYRSTAPSGQASLRPTGKRSRPRRGLKGLRLGKKTRTRL